MPLYEFECDACGRRFEELIRMNERRRPKCPKCKGANVHKRFSTFAMSGAAASGGNGGGCASCGGGNCATCH
jgi:putative FmdB family regulatory protein